MKSLSPAEKLDICKACPKFTKNWCRVCGCYMPFKTKIRWMTCPIKKW